MFYLAPLVANYLRAELLTDYLAWTLSNQHSLKYVKHEPTLHTPANLGKYIWSEIFFFLTTTTTTTTKSYDDDI